MGTGSLQEWNALLVSSGEFLVVTDQILNDKWLWLMEVNYHYINSWTQIIMWMNCEWIVRCLIRHSSKTFVSLERAMLLPYHYHLENSKVDMTCWYSCIHVLGLSCLALVKFLDVVLHLGFCNVARVSSIKFSMWLQVC